MTRNWSIWHIDAGGVAVLLLVAVATWFIGVRPVLARHDRAVAAQQSYVAVNQKLRETEGEIARLNTQLQETRRDCALHGQRLEPSSHLNHRLASLTELATNVGASLDDVQPGKVLPAARFDFMPIHLAGTGTYSQFTALLHAIREAHADIGIGALTVFGTPATTDQPANFSIDLLWYTQPTLKPAAK